VKYTASWHHDCPSQTLAVYEDLADDALIHCCRDGVAAAWSALVRRYQRLIFTIPRRAGLDESSAADVFQVCFQRLFEHLDRLEDPTRVRAWLVTTAKRETLRLLEQARRMPQAEATGPGDEGAEDPLALVPDPVMLQDEQLAELQTHDRLRRAVDRLDPRARQFIELVFLQDEPLSYSEISARLGIPEGSIGPTRVRCLAKLRKLMGES